METYRDPIIIKAGKQGRKRVKDLKKGKGKLLRTVEAAVEHAAQTSGTAVAQLVPVVILVDRKDGGGTKTPFGRLPKMPKLF